MKCLDKTPDRRYRAASELADDLRRYLNGQPVQARRIGMAGRAWKWLRRHPQAAALAVTVLLLLFIPVFSLLGYYRDRQAVRRKAENARPLVREILYRNCYECHGKDPDNIEKELDVLDWQRLLEKDRQIVVPGSWRDSRLIRRIEDGSMPPEEEEERRRVFRKPS